MLRVGQDDALRLLSGTGVVASENHADGPVDAWKGQGSNGDKKGKGKGVDGKDDQGKEERQRQGQRQSDRVFRGLLPRLQSLGAHGEGDCWRKQPPSSHPSTSPPPLPLPSGNESLGIREHSSQSIGPHDSWKAVQSDDCSEAIDTAIWMFSVTNRESNQNELMIDSGAATPVCQHFV